MSLLLTDELNEHVLYLSIDLKSKNKIKSTEVAEWTGVKLRAKPLGKHAFLVVGWLVLFS